MLMCGRYVSPAQAEAEREFNVHRVRWLFERSYNVAPTQQVPVVRQSEREREGVMMRWGLIPFFAKGEVTKYSTINARVETIATSAAYRGPWKRCQRCILPATGFYEWHVNEDGTKQPYYIHLTNQPVFGFAGLWDASKREDGTVLESATIITMPPNSLMADIHNAKQRMPAIIAHVNADAWLAGSTERAHAVLAAYPADYMAAWPVSTRVNSPKNNSAALIEPLGC